MEKGYKTDNPNPPFEFIDMSRYVIFKSNVIPKGPRCKIGNIQKTKFPSASDRLCKIKLFGFSLPIKFVFTP